MKILIANGPNLNLVGKREPGIYGDASLDEFLKALQLQNPDSQIELLFSNHEGELIDALHAHGFDSDGIILNPGGLTHTSVALRDAVTAIKTPVVEVHISHPEARESFRHKSLISGVCAGKISGLGLEGYRLALEFFLNRKGSLPH